MQIEVRRWADSRYASSAYLSAQLEDCVLGPSAPL
jgi:hypothetical protein